MKKKKRWLSLLMAAVMALTSCTVALTAFAAATDVEKVTEMLRGVTTVDKLTPTVAAAYKALTDGEKNGIEPMLLKNLYYAASNKYGTQEEMTAALGALTPEMQEGIALGQVVQNKQKLVYTYNGAEKAYAAGNTNGFTGILFSGNKAVKIHNPASSTSAKLTQITPAEQIAVYEALMAAWNGASEKARAFADFGGYAAGDTVLAAGDFNEPFTCASSLIIFIIAGTYNKKIVLDTSVMTQEQLEAFVGGLKWSSIAKGYIDWLGSMISIFDNFLAETISSSQYITKYDELMKAMPAVTWNNYNELLWFGEWNNIDGVDTWVPSAKYPEAIMGPITNEYNKIQGVKAYAEKLMGITLPESPNAAFNVTVLEAKETYKNLGSKYQKVLRTEYPDAFAKYVEVLCMEYDMSQTEGFHDVDAFVPQTSDYKLAKPYGAIISDTLIPSIQTILGTGELKPIVYKLLFTNNMVNQLLPTLANLSASMLAPGQTTPAQLFGPGGLFDPDVNTATAAYRDQMLFLGKCATWDDVPADLNWNVTTGDYDSFMDALTVLTAPIATMAGILLGNVGDTLGGYGIYERTIIPLMEALGAKNIMSSTEYTVRVANYQGDVTNTLRIIIDQLFDEVINPLLENPVDYLSKNLPNFLYHMQDGCIIDGLVEALTALNSDGSMTSIIDMVKSMGNLDGLLDMVNSLLAPMGITLNKADIIAIASMGKAEEVPTASVRYSTTVRVIGDAESVIRQLGKIVEPILLNLLGGIGVNFTPKAEFVKVEAPAYPHNGKMDKKVMLAMVGGFDSLLGSFVNLKDTINGLCTPENAANIITGLYGLIGTLDLASLGITLPVTPADVAKAMHEDKYADLRADLKVVGNTWSNVGLVIKNGDSVVYQTNMGFKAGERDAFINCIVASLRPLVQMMADANLLTNTKDSLGLYETLIIPLFEAIGLTPAVDSTAYTENYRKLALKEDKGAACDYLVKTILSPVIGLLDDLVAAPLNTLLNVLPNLAYAIQYSTELAFVGNLLDANGGLAGIVNGLIGGLLPGFELPAIPLDALASCGTMVEKTSKSIEGQKYTAVAADKADAFVTVYYYLYDTVNYKDNLKTLKTLISDMEDLDPALKGVIDNILNDVFTATKEESLCKLGGLLASDVWECPDAAGNDGKKTPGTGDSSISAIAVMSVMLTAGAAIVLLRRKKQTEI